MRKISSAEEIEKKKKRNVLIMSIFILAVLVISTLGYAFLSGDKEKDNGAQSGEGYSFSAGGETFNLAYSPQNVSWIAVNINKTLADYSRLPLYIVSDNNQITQEIALNIGRFTERTQMSCYGRCAKNLPERDCTQNLVVWNSTAAGERVHQIDNCVFIEGSVAAADAFIYKVFGFS